MSDLCHSIAPPPQCVHQLAVQTCRHPGMQCSGRQVCTVCMYSCTVYTLNNVYSVLFVQCSKYNCRLCTVIEGSMYMQFEKTKFLLLCMNLCIILDFNKLKIVVTFLHAIQASCKHHFLRNKLVLTITKWRMQGIITIIVQPVFVIQSMLTKIT